MNKRILLVVPIVSAIINIVLYTTFIPIYASSCLNVEKNVFYKRIRRCIISIIIMIIVCLFIKKFYEINSWLNLFYIAMIVALFVAIINYIIISSKDKKNISNMLIKS